MTNNGLKEILDRETIILLIIAIGTSLYIQYLLIKYNAPVTLW